MTRAADIVGFVGRKTSGKTFGALEESKSHKHVLRVDLNAQPDMAKGAVLINNKHALLHVAKNFNRTKKNTLLWRGEASMMPAEVFIWGLRFCVTVGGVTLFADECESMLPKLGKHDELIEALIRRNRHIGGPDPKKPLGVPFIWTACDDKEIHPRLRNQSERRYYFAGFDNNYKKNLREIFDGQMVDKLLNSPKYSKLLIDVDKGISLIEGPK